MTTYYLALENIENRYTIMMNDTLREHVDVVIYPDGFDRIEIKTGEFLDVNRTIAFKAAQVAALAGLFDQHLIHCGDRLLVGDLFMPGLEAVKYMAELQQLDVKVIGFNYAGRADESDFVQRLGKWSDSAERGWHQLADRVCVGSQFHADRVRRHFSLPRNQVVTTGLIWNIDWYAQRVDWRTSVPKEDFCLWPHRPCREKGLADFLAAAFAVPSLKFIITSCGPARTLPPLPHNVEYRPNLTKAEYLQLVQRARWFLSTAYQETFGYTLQEAILYGCGVLVPDRACYPEMTSVKALYWQGELVERLKARDFVHLEQDWTTRWHNNWRAVLAPL